MEKLNLTPEELVILDDLKELAKDAIEAAKLINEAYTFKIGQDKVVVWEDSYNHEYVTNDGIWQARYLHQTYDVKSTSHEIYKLLKNEYIYRNNHNKDKYYRDQAEIAGYFRTFINKTKERLEKTK